MKAYVLVFESDLGFIGPDVDVTCNFAMSSLVQEAGHSNNYPTAVKSRQDLRDISEERLLGSLRDLPRAL